MRFFAGLVALATLPTSASQVSPAVWDVYGDLFCRYDEGQQCSGDLSDCHQSEGRALIEFDFRKNLATVLGAAKPEVIVGRYHCTADDKTTPDRVMREAINAYCGLGTIYTGRDAIYTFWKPDSTEIVSSDTIEGVAQSGGQVVSAYHMTCHPHQ